MTGSGPAGTIGPARAPRDEHRTLESCGPGACREEHPAGGDHAEGAPAVGVSR